MRIRRGYVDAGWGQVHYREAGQGVAGAAPALVCLHATAYSGRSLEPLVQRLAWRRRVIAIDTPGYGGSDAPPAPPGLEAYATAIAEAFADLTGDRPVDLFGYHTGAMLAVEIAAQYPSLVRRLVLIGVPFFEDAEKAAWRAKLVRETALGDRLDQFGERWDFLVAQRANGFSLERGFGNFVDELAAFPREWWAHHALFAYDAAPRLALVRQPVLVINPDSPLAAASRAAASRMPMARVTEMRGVSGAIFEIAWNRIGNAIEGHLLRIVP